MRELRIRSARDAGSMSRMRNRGCTNAMKQGLFNLAVALSFLLCIATVALWVLSYWALVRLDHVAAKSYLSVTSQLGSVRLERVEYTMTGQMPDMWRFDAAWLRTEGRSTLFGHTDARGGFSGASWHRREWWGPHWAAGLLFAVLPLVAAMRLRRGRRRASLNLCVACGYDLRATPERCPECGLQRVQSGEAAGKSLVASADIR